MNHSNVETSILGQINTRTAFNKKQSNILRNSTLVTGLLIFLQCFLFNQISAATISTEISVNAKTRSLVAPAGENFQWFLNNQPLKEGHQQSLKVSKSGYYSVDIKDDCGTVTRHNAMIIVKGNAIRKIYLIGDSTVANYRTGSYPQTGWGQVLKYFFNAANVTIDNRAVGGTSAKSFYNIYWAGIRNSLQSGDYVFIQFGINDSNRDTARRTEPFTTFTAYLTKYVKEARAKGAIPVLVSTLNRNSWKATTPPTVYPAYHDYPVATRQLAQSSLNVPLIDLDKKCTALLESVGPTYSAKYLYMNLAVGEYPNYSNGKADDVHFQEMGAIEMAKLVVQGIRELSADTNVKTLIPFLLPTYNSPVYTNNAAAGLITRSNTFPAGLTITLKAIPNTGYKLSRWVDGLGKTVATTPKFSFVMGTNKIGYRAVFASTARAEAEVEETTTSTVSVSPNPSSGVFVIKAQGDFNYTIVDQAGKPIATGKAANEIAVGNNLPAALYLIKVEQAGKTSIIKAIKE